MGRVGHSFLKKSDAAGRLSPNTMKYAWVEAGSEEKPKSTLQIADLRKNAPPVKVPFDGIFGHCYWSRDGRELVVSMFSFVEQERTYQTWRVSADGLKTVKLPIPATEFVHDWSRDGRWLVTTSGRRVARRAAYPAKPARRSDRPSRRDRRSRLSSGAQLFKPRSQCCPRGLEEPACILTRQPIAGMDRGRRAWRRSAGRGFEPDSDHGPAPHRR